MRETEVCRVLAPKYNAITEAPIWDGTRCDLLNDEYAIEVDWAPKWAEAIGQALYYGITLDRKPAILLVLKNGIKDRKYAHRAQTVCSKLGIRMYLERLERII